MTDSALSPDVVPNSDEATPPAHAVLLVPAVHLLGSLALTPAVLLVALTFALYAVRRVDAASASALENSVRSAPESLHGADVRGPS